MDLLKNYVNNVPMSKPDRTACRKFLRNLPLETAAVLDELAIMNGNGFQPTATTFGQLRQVYGEDAVKQATELLDMKAE